MADTFALSIYGAAGPYFLYQGQPGEGRENTEPGFLNQISVTDHTLLSLLLTPVNSPNSGLYAAEYLDAFNQYSPFLLNYGLFTEELAWQRMPHSLLQRFFRNWLGNPSLSTQSRENYLFFHIGTHAFAASLLLTISRPYQASTIVNVGVYSTTFLFWLIFMLALRYSNMFETI